MASVSGCGIVDGMRTGGGRGDVVVWCLYPERAHVDEKPEGRFREEAEKFKERLKVGVEKGTGDVE